MERIDLYRLYVIGSEVHPMVVLANDKTTLSGLFFPMYQARGALESLLGDDSPVSIELSRSAALDVIKTIDRIEGSYFRDQEGKFAFPSDGSATVPSWDIVTLTSAARDFESVFRAEMQRAATYRVPKRGTYDTGDLVDRAADTFPAEMRYLAGELCLTEYQAAGRCYAFGLFTAAGYHACRAVEAVLRSYHLFYIGKNSKETDSWGSVIGELEKVKGIKTPSKKTLDHIRHVKDYDRNPLSHLRANLDVNDADILLAGTKVVITAMCRDMEAHKSAVEPTLALVSDNNG